MWNRRGELKRRTRCVVAVVQVDDMPVGAVKRQCERYRKTYKLVLALAAGGNCKMIVKTSCLYKRQIYSRWARENLIFSLVPYEGSNSSKTSQLQGRSCKVLIYAYRVRRAYQRRSSWLERRLRFARYTSGRIAYVGGSDGQAQGRVRDGDLVTGWLAFFPLGP